MRIVKTIRLRYIGVFLSPNRAMDTYPIKSFEDLHRMVMVHGHSHFIFRGEDTAQYPLRPKFGRDKMSVLENFAGYEQRILETFKRRGSPHVSVLPLNDWEWLAVAQHFGLATRLLDWTENPLVAAYFATATKTSTDRVLYALKRDSLQSADEKSSPFELQAVVLYPPKHIATRIMAQTGLFTVHDQPAEVFTHPELERWIIAADAVIELNVALDNYGFNRATMFPGLDGLAHHINDWWLRGVREDVA